MLIPCLRDRDKAVFCFDMFDFEGREEASYDEVAICISTIVGALSKVTCCLCIESMTLTLRIPRIQTKKGITD